MLFHPNIVEAIHELPHGGFTNRFFYIDSDRLKLPEILLVNSQYFSHK